MKDLTPGLSARESWLDEICVYCLDELRRGIPEDGKCGHEELLKRDREAARARDNSVKHD